MSNQFFEFKKFKIDQSNCAMKVGTDGVLLGSWCDIYNKKNILDIGTGTGLIALMMAQRNPDAQIDAIELDENATFSAKKNFNNSPWSDRIKVKNIALQEFNPGYKYDLIVTNPPFFENSLKNPDQKRSQARHTDSLPFDFLIDKSIDMLNEDGILSMIVPVFYETRIKDIVEKKNLSIFRIVTIKGTLTGKAIRLLIEIGHKSNYFYSETKEETLCIEKSRQNYKEEYINLTKDFYLKM